MYLFMGKYEKLEIHKTKKKSKSCQINQLKKKCFAIRSGIFEGSFFRGGGCCCSIKKIKKFKTNDEKS